MDEQNKNEILYMPSQWCKRMEPSLVVSKHIEVVQLLSQKMKKSKYCKMTNVNYGPSDCQVLDIYENELVPSEHTFIYVHGGYWQELNKDISAYCVEPLINSAIRVIVPGYDLTPTVTLKNIVEEIQQLLYFIKTSLKYKNIWLGGHSAGAHLAASMIHPKVNENFGIKGFILISGVFDLYPLLETTINNAVKLNRNMCLELSPINTLNKLNFSSMTSPIKVLVVCAENDSPAFHYQSFQFARLLDKLGLDVTEEQISGVDHFDIVENLSNSNYSLSKQIINLILQDIID